MAFVHRRIEIIPLWTQWSTDLFKRGGKGNIGSPKVKPAHHGTDVDVIPETATKLTEQHSHHTGRGGGKLHLSRLFVYADD